jgi:hypothetical protein
MHRPRDRGDSPLSAQLDDPALSAGQRRRVRLFAEVESTVTARMGELWEAGGLEVVDTAALVVGPTAIDLLFGDAPGHATRVLLGHRRRIYDFLSSALPKAEHAPFDPYVDLLDPAPPRCVRVLVLDHETLTVLCYGTFVTVAMDDPKRGLA